MVPVTVAVTSVGALGSLALLAPFWFSRNAAAALLLPSAVTRYASPARDREAGEKKRAPETLNVSDSSCPASVAADIAAMYGKSLLVLAEPDRMNNNRD